VGEDLGLKALHDHSVSPLDLCVFSGVGHGGPIYMDVVFIIEL
jgi:hypothetical protein